MFRTYFNTTDTAVLVSDDGRQIDGSTWGSADPDDERAATAIDAGLIVEVDPPSKSAKPDTINPVAVAAFRATDELNAAPTELAAPAAGDNPKE